jgi:hypothetical protein
MRRLGFLIAAILLAGLFWGGVVELADRLGIQVWLQTRMEANDSSPRPNASTPEQ